MEDPKVKSCDEVLIKAMEKFGEIQPTGLVVCWIDSKGIVNWEYNIPAYQALGILGVVMNCISIDAIGKRFRL